MNKKDFRICTITHHTVPNYGAVLQAYALQKAIEMQGYQSEILNYQPERVKQFYHQSLRAQKGIKEKLRHIVYYKRFHSWNSAFKTFLERELTLSVPYREAQITLADGKYDLYIAGSDQVWNLQLHRGSKRYMLDFVTDDAAKGSYAASFGYSKVPVKFEADTKKALESFHFINVREESGQKIVQEMVGKEKKVSLVLDPTLLLPAESWQHFVQPVEQQGYILIYEICRIKESFEYALYLAQKTGKRIVSIQSFENQKFVEEGDIEYLYGVTPEKFLSLIYYADYVVTSSFHGTVFSIVFEKTFFCTMTANKNGTNGRLENILELTGLQNRLTGMESYDEKIDFDAVKHLLEPKIQDSLQELISMIQIRIDELKKGEVTK